MANGQSNISMIGSAVTAWRDGFAAFRHMPALLGVAVLASIALDLVNVATIPREFGEPVSFAVEVWVFFLGLIQALLLTPVAIAVHRFVLLGERTVTYRIDLSHPRFRKFFFFAAMIQILLYIPPLIVAADATKASGWVAGLAVLTGIVLTILALITMLRTLILFPAVAVDAPGAEWSNALQDRKGHSWRLLFIVVATGIPLMAAYLPLLVWLKPSWQDLTGTAILMIAAAVETVFGTAVLAALASRLFRTFADRLGHPPGVAGSLSAA